MIPITAISDPHSLPSHQTVAATESVEIVYADEAFVVLNKPSGLLSVPGRGPDKQDCLASRVQARYPDAKTVHRLDLDTSGLILMARGSGIQGQLGRMFQERKVSKRYQALVSGRLDPEIGEVNLPLIVDWPHRPRQMVCFENGKPSLTHYRRLRFEPKLNASRVELSPITGRSHQLRVHMQALGHPILGDSLYAPPEILAQSPRLLLHACYLSFNHPITFEKMEFNLDPEF